MVGVFLCLHLYRYFTTNLPLDGRLVHLAVAGVLKTRPQNVLAAGLKRPRVNLDARFQKVQEFSFVGVYDVQNNCPWKSAIS